MGVRICVGGFMITAEERNVAEETKFIIAARLLRSYIHENLTGTKATRYIKNKKGNASLRFNICRQDRPSL